MSSLQLPVPAVIDRIQQRAMIAGIVGAAALVAGGLMNHHQFFRSYLFGFLVWLLPGLGCICLLMIQHLTGGTWGVVVRRILEAGAKNMFLVPVLFVPVALGLADIFHWAAPGALDDPVIKAKSLYLNPGFFLLRAGFYFAVWAGIVYFLRAFSLEQDTKGDDAREVLRLSRRMRGISGGGLVAMGLTITFASVDWAMSLNPHWFSTIYGVLFMVGSALSAHSMAIYFVARLATEKPMSDVASKTAVHDLGKLLLAFVMLWAYISLSQFLIVWSGNIPEEIPWYLTRLHGGWQYLATILLVFHFALPFLLLLSRDLKRKVNVLATVAGCVFLVRVVEVFWLVAPDLQGHGGEHHGLSIHWLDAAAPLAIGGLWLWWFARSLKERPLLPVGDPELRELLGVEEVRA